MAPRLRVVWLAIACFLAAANLPRFEKTALAAGLDAKGQVTAKEAAGLYRQGLYEDAAKLFAKLVVDYPEMPIFERSLGACFYYLHKPEPALSNLRNYLVHRKDIPPDDKAVVDRWIDEMEKLRGQNAATAAAATVPLPGTPATTGPTVQEKPLVASPATPPSAAAPMLAALPPSSLAVPATPSALPVPIAAPLVTPALNLTAQPAPSPANSPDKAKPVYKTRWFWGTVGAVLAAGAITYVVLSAGKGDSNIPQTALGNQGTF